MINFNLNNYVLIQIFPLGWEILEKEYGSDYIKYCIKSYAVDIEGETWYRLQLWQVMNMFGEHIGNGLDIPIGTNIKFDING
jgi:hypothetical protein